MSEQRADAAFLRRKDDEHVSMFKSRDYAAIIEVQEIRAVTRYITELEADNARIAELSKDAERYRWLRRRAVMIDASDDVSIVLTLFRAEGPTGEFLDDQVDTLSQSTEGKS